MGLINSHITIKKQFDVTITGNSTGAISSGSSDETFIPYDEEDYVLIRTDVNTETLSSDKYNIKTSTSYINYSRSTSIGFSLKSYFMG